tara:strand:+ start:258 stop:2135 length:1878 start_codon:yes stop_codon:yes gene_type:complete
MCGIIAGITTEQQNISQILFNGLKQLQNRGYDSAGITIFNNNDFYTHKYASDNNSALDKLEDSKCTNLLSNIGIAHTRWATHGPKTDINSHPHQSYTGNFILVHNGIIENYLYLKNVLEEHNINCISETDTEVIVNTLDLNYSIEKNIDIAIEKTLSQLEGTWGLAILTKHNPNTLYCTRKGSPLLISMNQNLALIVSEQSAFCNQTNNYIVLENDDICKLELIDEIIHMSMSKNIIYKELSINETNITLTPEPYNHWTEKEIFEQVDSVLRVISLGGRLLSTNQVKLGGLDQYKSELLKINNLILLGCGTSYFAAQCGKKYINDLCNFNTIQVIDGGEFELSDIPNSGYTALILLSQSGETKDLHRCLELCKDLDIITIGVVNVVDSLIAREVDCGCYLNAGREVGVASTKSFVSQVIMLSMIAIWFAQTININLQKRKKHIKDLRKLYLDIENTLKNISNIDSSGIVQESPSIIDNLVPCFNKFNSCFILGKGKSEFIAKEGALKIKEISYIHAEGYSSSSLKHGPLALLEQDFPVILLAPNNIFFKKNMNAYEEIRSRNANIILVTNDINIDRPNAIIVEKNDSYADLLSIIPIQLLAYKLSIYRGNNPDMPRNLAKVVTVE